MTTDPSDKPAIVQLREHLDLTERRIVTMFDAPQTVVEVIQNIDRIDRLLGKLRQMGVDIRGEESRADALHQRLLREPDRAFRQVQAIKQAKQLVDSPAWRAVYARALVTRNEQRRRSMMISIGVAVLVVLLVAAWWLLAPPEPSARIESIGNLALAGDYSGALALAQAEHTRVPTDPEVVLWVGALQQRQGDTAVAAEAWRAARGMMADDALFYFKRGLILNQIAEIALAEADAQQLLADPNALAQGHFLLGHIRTSQGRLTDAVAEFEESARLAEQGGNAQLAAIAKLQIANVYRMSMPTADR